MARPINAALFVDAFSPTAVPGEYTFANALFNNQADITGNGAYDVQIGFALYVPATNANVGTQIPGVVHRYKITALTVADPYTISGTILWDEPGTEGIEVPTNGIGCLLCETSPISKLGFIPSDSIYSELISGNTSQALVVDLWNIVDSGGATTGTYKTDVGDGSSTTIVVTHSLATTDVSVEVFEISTGSTVYCGISRTTANSVTLSFTEAPGSSDCRVLVKKI